MIYLVIFYEENRNITATRKQVISSKEDKKEEIVIEFLKLPQNMNITKHEPMRKMPMRPATGKLVVSKNLKLSVIYFLLILVDYFGHNIS